MSERNRDRQRNASKRSDQKAKEKTERKRQRRETIGTVLFEVSWFLMDAFWFWPISHVLAVWAGWFGIAVAVYRHVESLDLVVRLVAGLAIVAVLVQPHLPPIETEFHGWLTPGDDPVPPNQCAANEIPADALLVLLGTSGAWTTVLAKKIAPEVSILDLCDRVMLGATQSSDGGLLINATVFDGRIVAEIRNNEFTLNPNNLFRVERPDRHTLIVYDQDGNQRLNFRFLNPRTVKVLGTFGHSPGCGRSVEVSEDSIRTFGYPPGPPLSRLCLGDFQTAIVF